MTRYVAIIELVPRVNVATEKRAAFFAVRIFLATISVLVEATLFRSIADRINDRVGRYHFFLMFFSAGMWNASTGVSDPNSFLSNSSNNNFAAFLPSTFAMYTTMLACSYAFTPTSTKNKHRTLAATSLFAAGGIIGWPFALALAIPFIFEELFVFGADVVPPEARRSWMAKRFTRLLIAGLMASLIFVCLKRPYCLHSTDPVPL